ncbi:MAG TPA: hypothetical protein PKO05_00200 [Thermoanaerobaculia bacterium]|nr:MAG: hypothetical protein BWX64_02661 [Acidobacteria bacterium ADurb.Bin051]HNU81835.1 hypothetical protein [Thermoanaerobaculia bacterium]
MSAWQVFGYAVGILAFVVIFAEVLAEDLAAMDAGDARGPEE